MSRSGRAARPAGAFRQRYPNSGAAATERIEVRAVFERGRLTIGDVMFDRRPIACSAIRCDGISRSRGDDRFIVTLDTLAHGRGRYVFQTNPAGAQAEALIVSSTNTSDDRRSSNCVFECAYLSGRSPHVS